MRSSTVVMKVFDDRSTKATGIKGRLTRRGFIASLGVGVSGVGKFAEAGISHAATLGTATSPYSTGLPVTTQRYLFLDDTFVEYAHNVRRNFHQAHRLQEKPIIVPDR